MQLDKPGTEKIRKARDDREMSSCLQALTAEDADTKHPHNEHVLNKKATHKACY